MTTVATKSRPILFSAPMVRALLAGTKTQTRRIVKKMPPDPFNINGDRIELCMFTGQFCWKDKNTNCECRGVSCPYGVPGARLWVRETFVIKDGVLFYAATFKDKDPDGPRMPWNPSIHMPRWASRITLEITDVRVQRVQEIDGGDAIAEGVSSTEFWTPKEVDGYPFEEKMWDDFEFWNRYPPIAYKRLWDSINGDGSFDANPWVWALTFKLVTA